MATWVNVRKVILIILSIGISMSCLQTLSFPVFAGQVQNRSTVKVYSHILEEERTIYVYLPDGYEYGALGKTYPVLYVLDAEGAVLFPNSISTVEGLAQKGSVPEMILVGIRNTTRNRDMIPEAVSHRPGSGGSENFLGFIQNELKPFIHKNYRSSEYSLLYGMSNSALFAVYAFLEKPETFNAVIASSPMIGHCPEYIQKKAETFIAKNLERERFLYMIFGTEDSRRVTEFVPGFKKYLDMHAPKSLKIKLDILQGEGHVPDSSLTKGILYVFSH